MKQSEFIGRISSQLGRSQVPNTAPERSVRGVPDFFVEQMNLSLEERIERFCDRLIQLGGEVQVVSDLISLRMTVEDILHRLAPRRIGIWNDVTLNDWIGTALQTCDVTPWSEDARATFADIDIGITGCSFAIADTGTLVLACAGGRGRSVHLLPPVHLAVVGASQIRNRLGEALHELSETPELASYVHFVTGPSRSSDIENDQSIGVHGPAAETVIVVESL